MNISLHLQSPAALLLERKSIKNWPTCLSSLLWKTWLSSLTGAVRPCAPLYWDKQPRRGHRSPHTLVLETRSLCFFQLCVWVVRCCWRILGQLGWYISFKFMVSKFSEFSTLLFPLGYLLSLLWDNYFMFHFFSLNLQIPLPTCASHGQVINQMLVCHENRRNWMETC